MTFAPSMPRSSAFRAPTAATLGRLCLGGLAGLMIWEAWARLLTPLVLDGPLEPAGLVISLARRWTGYELARLPAEAIHYAIGIVGYPVAYWLVSRMLPRWGLVLDLGVWAIFTLFVLSSIVSGGSSLGLFGFWAVVSLVTGTRALNPDSLVADCLSWGSFTWFNALGLMAPLAGLPFLLIAWGGGLSFMSYVGHVIYGFVAALVFERLERRARAG
jgi:hypothetical protein